MRQKNPESFVILMKLQVGSLQDVTVPMLLREVVMVMWKVKVLITKAIRLAFWFSWKKHGKVVLAEYLESVSSQKKKEKNSIAPFHG